MEIGRGAEAVLTRDGDVVRKERVSKKYRHEMIDSKLRLARTRREAKVLEKLSVARILAPKLLAVDEKTMTITISFLDGRKLRDVFHTDAARFSRDFGALVGKLHTQDIIHADLTTSNVIVHDNKLHSIDFGLSFFSAKPEDKACDLHLLAQALQSKHHEHYPDCWKFVLEGYCAAYEKHDEVLKRLEVVEKRGRNKQQKK